MIMEMETPDEGNFKIGETVKISYVDQTHKDLDPDVSKRPAYKGQSAFE